MSELWKYLFQSFVLYLGNFVQIGLNHCRGVSKIAVMYIVINIAKQKHV